MHKSLSRTHGFSIKVRPAAQFSTGERVLLATGKRGPAFPAPVVASCGDCRDFQTVMVRSGGQLVAVDCPACRATGDDMPTRRPSGSPKPNRATAADRPQLPMRPTPHERDGRQGSPAPARPHPRSSLLAG